MVDRQPLHGVGADIVANETGPLDAERLHDGVDVGRQHVRSRPVVAAGQGIAALAEAAEIGRDQPVAVGQPLEHRLPGRPELRPAVQQQERRALAALGDMGPEAAGLDEAVLDRWHG